MSEMSNQMETDNGVNDTGTNVEGVTPGREPIVQQDGPGRQPATARSRIRWSKEINKVVMECYYLSKPVDENGRPVRGYRRRFYNFWRERDIFPVSEQRLCDQQRAIVNNGWLTEVELEQIQRQLLNEDINAEEGNPIMITEDNVTETEIEVNESDGRLSLIVNSEGLDEEEIGMIQNILSIFENESFGGIKPFKKVDRCKLSKLTGKVNKILKYVETNNISETNNLIRAAETYIANELGIKEETPRRKKEPWWKRRIEEDINILKKHISILDRKMKGQLRRNTKIEYLDSKYNITLKGIDTVFEELKQRLLAKKAKINRYQNRITQFRQNRLFHTSEKKFYEEMNGGRKGDGIVPDAEESKQFWGGIWDNSVKHKENAEWLKKMKNETKVRKQGNIIITVEMVRKQCKKIPNWKSAGPDGVQGFWIKRLTELHQRIATQLTNILGNPEYLPKWMTYGRTVLCLKDISKGAAVDNFRPISCLPLMWKLMTGVLADAVYVFLESESILVEEQKGCKRRSRGTKDQLLSDKAVLKECKRRRSNLAMAWVDYKKAYDMVPHSWIRECLDMFGIAENVKQFISVSMRSWETELTSGGQKLGRVKIRRGIYQGDSLSPLLFVICMIPLTIILRQCKAAYEFKQKERINHLLFMDDLKLYGKDENQIDSLIQTVFVFSRDIGMEFGVRKCGVIILRRGKVVRTDGVELPNGETIRSIEADGYKYLGILEADTILEKEMKEMFQKEYLRRLRCILKSKLNGKNKIKGINSWAVSLLRYGGGLISWKKEELQKLDRKSRKLMTMYGMLHPKSDVDRIYVSRKEGGRGLIGCEMCIKAEENNLGWYIRNSVEILLKQVKQCKVIETENCSPKDEYKKRISENRKVQWQQKILHGQYVRDLPGDTDLVKSWDWLTMSDLKPETEALIIAAQDQSLRTNYVKFHIDKTTDSPLCRMCKEKGESVMHILSECSKLAQREYKRRHDNVARIVHWELCGMYKIERAKNWYEHEPKAVIESDEIKILWDFNIQCDHIIEHRRPDILVVNKKEKSCQIIDIAVPGDLRVHVKEGEKVEKYGDLKREIARLWSLKKVEVIPVVVGALGAVTKHLEKFIKKVGMKTKISYIQKTVLLGSARILRKVLET